MLDKFLSSCAQFISHFKSILWMLSDHVIQITLFPLIYLNNTNKHPDSHAAYGILYIKY